MHIVALHKRKDTSTHVPHFQTVIAYENPNVKKNHNYYFYITQEFISSQLYSFRVFPSSNLVVKSC